MNFDEFFNRNFTLEERMTNPGLRADTLLVWDTCKQEVLKILQQNWTGADLSVNACDKHYIERIKKEL